ncbi:MCE family protein [Nocardioides panacisoli]|uniref:MCE family protein n=1 Tax=Nocardioides panacisoli TaxID=627624 RepID=A0ABP7J3D9_9ACTN
MSTTTLRRLALAVIAAVLFSTSGCGVLPGSAGSREISAYFEDSAGLFKGNDVGILGVVVGKITDISPDGDRVKVTMEVDGDYKIPQDAGAVVVARSVATDRYVELTPVYTGGPEMKDGAEIPLNRTRTPVDFDQVLQSLNRFATGIAGSKDTIDAVKRFISAGTKALQGRGPLLNQTIHSLADGVNGLNAQREDVAATIKSLDTLLGTVAQNEGTARTFIQQVAKASDLLASERTNFRTALRTLNTAVTQVARFAVDNRDQIVRALGGSTRLMRNVLGKQDQLQEILRDMPLALQNIQLAKTSDNKLPTVLDPLALAPLGGLLQGVCDKLPPAVCDLLSLQPLGRPQPGPAVGGGAR